MTQAVSERTEANKNLKKFKAEKFFMNYFVLSKHQVLHLFEI